MAKNGPWEVEGSEERYENPWMRVREDKVVQPDGKKSIFGVVTLPPGISVLAIDGDENAYLVNEFRYALRRFSLETVSGAIDEGESPLEAAKRELKEEAGISANEWFSFGTRDPLSSSVSCPQELYLARGLTFGGSAPEGAEVLEVVKLPFSEAVRKVMQGEITYGPSCALILMANEYLRAERV